MKNSYLQRLFGLDGRVALVTGAGSGLGREISLALAQAGAKVVLAGRRGGMLEETRRATGCEEAGAVQADLSRLEEVGRLVAEAPKFFGAPDILVNAAAVNNRAGTGELSAEEWQQTVDTNLRAPFFLSRGMVEAPGGMGESKRGSIINVGSLQSLRAGLGDAAYGASKAALVQLTRFGAKEWGPRNIRVNALIPGFFPTAMTESVWQDSSLRARLAESTCLLRTGEPEEIGAAAVFLASDAASHITGCCLPVDGGFLAR